MNEKKRESENVKRIFAIASSFSGKPYPVIYLVHIFVMLKRYWIVKGD
jgi:hypothetical protein